MITGRSRNIFTQLEKRREPVRLSEYTNNLHPLACTCTRKIPVLLAVSSNHKRHWAIYKFAYLKNKYKITDYV